MMWIMHSVICRLDLTASSKFYAFAFGLLNIWTLFFWGLIKAARKIFMRYNYSEKDIRRHIEECDEKMAAAKKELEELNL